eukprot:gnl/TRDRNA2_/TRDRNA2_193238_c0_seq1.p1 gnl/TRDRNA2_/TRDRNA2_193238_c0~~gnl/TRDRNA2_/TRDRNA2_193238_c0_seq1.p1  ORF type:complete len:526 (-),score=106.67 gnl/TRDRNA2_/TRDRNA2_193238_c0_seq1:100-1677(-)
MSRRNSKSVVDQRYKFEWDIGQWAYGSLHVRRDSQDGSLKICKTVPKNILRVNPSSVLQKLKALKDLQHAHINPVVDALEDDDYFYIFSEYLPGNDVADWLERFQDGQAISEATVAAYVKMVLLALVHTHSTQTYHRDLRPSSLLLTSKLPDAEIKVCDCGVAAILDPENMYVQSSYTAPELLQRQQFSSLCDIYSVGAIAHKLLVGQEPQDENPMSQAWSLLNKITSRPDEGGWSERSESAHDFVFWLLRPVHDGRPTAVKALQHPWLKAMTAGGGVPQMVKPGVPKQNTGQDALLCYVLAVIMAPVLLPYRDFEQLRDMFLQYDHDRDGFMPRGTLQEVLASRCGVQKAIVAALSIADVQQTGMYDLCAATVADILAREFIGNGPTIKPLSGPTTAPELVPHMLSRCIESCGDRQAQTLTSIGCRNRLRTATARDLESYCGVRYTELLAALPENRPVDSSTLAAALLAAGGRGTPVGIDAYEASEADDVEDGGILGAAFDMINMFGNCRSHNRDESPLGLRHY